MENLFQENGEYDRKYNYALQEWKSRFLPLHQTALKYYYYLNLNGYRNRVR